MTAQQESCTNIEARRPHTVTVDGPCFPASNIWCEDADHIIIFLLLFYIHPNLKVALDRCLLEHSLISLNTTLPVSYAHFTQKQPTRSQQYPGQDKGKKAREAHSTGHCSHLQVWKCKYCNTFTMQPFWSMSNVISRNQVNHFRAYWNTN